MKFISILLFVSLWALVLLSCVHSAKSSTECTEQKCTEQKCTEQKCTEQKCTEQKCTEQKCTEQKSADAQKKYETTMFWIPDGKSNIRPQFIITEKAR